MEERVIKIDQLIEDLKYDINNNRERLENEIDDFSRRMTQFDIDCKTNFIWLLEDEYEKQHGNE